MNRFLILAHVIISLLFTLAVMKFLEIRGWWLVLTYAMYWAGVAHSVWSKKKGA